MLVLYSFLFENICNYRIFSEISFLFQCLLQISVILVMLWTFFIFSFNIFNFFRFYVAQSVLPNTLSTAVIGSARLLFSQKILLPKFQLKIRLSIFSQTFSVVSVGFIPILCYTDPGWHTIQRCVCSSESSKASQLEGLTANIVSRLSILTSWKNVGVGDNWVQDS